MELSRSRDSSDFGSCVALHRFLYDHWDHVRQRLVAQERMEFSRSSNESARGRSPVLEPVRDLMANLGPPPMAVTWNRPLIANNTPPVYSRFQNFMLQNAFRGTESFLTARAVYDGGESKDGLPVICLILRNVEDDAVDYDMMLYCYLKIASRMWHRPFGLLIDATCYSGLNEPQDNFLQKLDFLAPAELSKQLTRIYIYNMNTACKKCFRRVLRMSAKKADSVFNPKHTDFHLLGGLPDLQSQFHLSELHLPKETISVVADTRYVFQPIKRVSRSKGKMEVIIKVGNQYIQITTTEKQDVYPGIRTTTNDAFRISDVEEAPALVQAEDPSAFGLRTENGRMVMCFTSPKKTEILAAIRSAKAKLGKDTRAARSFERLIRPQDVPGTLLNLAFFNLASADHALRLSSYNLLGSLCKAFKFKAASHLTCAKEISVPMDPSRFIFKISRLLARTEPQLTSDFLNEFFIGWGSFSDEQKSLSLAYMAPWLPGLRSGLLAHEPDSDRGREKVAALIGKLIQVTLHDPTIMFNLEQTVWPVMAEDEILLDICLDELFKTAFSLGFMDEQTEILTSIAASIGTVTLRGKVISRIRKTLGRSNSRPTKHLPDNAVWSELSVLLQFCLALSFDSGEQAQLYLPEIFHIVTMLANTGSPGLRSTVHRLLVNTIHSACTCFQLDEGPLSKLRSTLDALADPRSDLFPSAATFLRDGAASMSTTQDPVSSLNTTDCLAALLFETCSVAAPTADLANTWRARWMSLVATTAFQTNLAIQPRAFTVMGWLAREEVDDDLLYQVLVALRNSVGRFSDDGHSDMVVAILTSLSKMMAELRSASRYGWQLFWLAISLLRLLPQELFNCTAVFLEAVLSHISTSADMRGEKLVPCLLHGRAKLQDAALALDDVYGIHFGKENFHFAACACLVRGLTDTVTKSSALRVLSTLLEMTSWSGSEHRPKDLSSSPYMALILARTVSIEELRECLWSAGINPTGLSDMGSLRARQDLGAIKDRDLLLNTAMELVDFQYLEDAVQNRTLQWLNEVAVHRPAVIMHLCSPIISNLDDILLHCQNSATLESAHSLLQTLTSSSKFSLAPKSGSVVLAERLEDEGFGGLWRSCSFNTTHDQDKDCFGLTEKLIEVGHFRLSSLSLFGHMRTLTSADSCSESSSRGT